MNYDVKRAVKFRIKLNRPKCLYQPNDLYLMKIQSTELLLTNIYRIVDDEYSTEVLASNGYALPYYGIYRGDLKGLKHVPFKDLPLYAGWSYISAAYSEMLKAA